MDHSFSGSRSTSRPALLIELFYRYNPIDLLKNRFVTGQAIVRPQPVSIPKQILLLILPPLCVLLFFISPKNSGMRINIPLF